MKIKGWLKWLFGCLAGDRAKMTVSRDLHCENGLLQNLTSSAMAVERCNYLKFNSPATKICTHTKKNEAKYIAIGLAPQRAYNIWCLRNKLTANV